MYTKQEAAEVLKATEHNDARIERRKDGTYRAVHDHKISAGGKKVRVTRHLIAQWHQRIASDLWSALPPAGQYSRDGQYAVTQEMAESIRDAIILPKNWHWPLAWFADGYMFVYLSRSRTVTSHC